MDEMTEAGIDEIEASMEPREEDERAAPQPVKTLDAGRAATHALFAQVRERDRRHAALTLPEGLLSAAQEVLEDVQVARWCDEYMARLWESDIRLRPRPRGVRRDGTRPPMREYDTDTKGSGRALLAAICSMMRERRTSVVTAAIETLAARASLSTATVERMMRRLEESAYIVRHVPVDYRSSLSWSLVMGRLDALKGPLTPISHDTDLESLATGDLSDAAYKAAHLGKSAAAAYAYLVRHPDSRKADLAGGLSWTRTRAGSAIKRLHELGLADERGGRWRVYTMRVSDDSDLALVVAKSREIYARRKAGQEAQREAQREAQANRERVWEAVARSMVVAETRRLIAERDAREAAEAEAREATEAE